MAPRRDRERTIVLQVAGVFSSEMHYVRISPASLQDLYEESDLKRRSRLFWDRATNIIDEAGTGPLDWDGCINPRDGDHASWADLLDVLISADLLDASVDWVVRAREAVQAACVLES